EGSLGAKVVRAERQGERRSGGRPAWFVDIERGDERLACYARMDRGPEQIISRSFTLEREYRVLRALAAAGARVPRVHGFCPDPGGLLMERVPGEFDYTKLAPGPARDALDDDFLAELARIHAIDPQHFVAAGIEAPRSEADCVLHDLALWEGAYRAALRRPVPLVEFATRWLRRNLPSAPRRLSLVQGDTGPGQFLFSGSRVTAIIDWEFAHLGDPVLDLAQIRTRDFYNPGIDLGRWIAGYEALSRAPVDRRKLAYYTVKSMLITPLALAGVVQNMHPQTDHAEWYTQDVAYKRATAEALVEALGVEVEAPVVPTLAETDRSAIYSLVEENLRDEHRPAAPDDYARYRLDLTRRLLTHLRNADAFGASLERDELDEIGQLVGTRPRDAAEGDRVLAGFIEASDASADSRIAAHLYRRSVREEALWRGALGAGEQAVFQRLE
ncbi:phosphotransferase family protein, partial [Myxococcota bacterium]|nr:phosphotransferase family protein [Myxococcota bacterium]